MRIQYQIIYWRDIPVQLRLRYGRTRLSYALPEIFQKTVYRAAYRGKAITGDAFQESWHTEGWFYYEGEGGAEDLEAVATTIATELIEAYSELRLNLLALNKGNEP
jgi:hypothetical protein